MSRTVTLDVDKIADRLGPILVVAIENEDWLGADLVLMVALGMLDHCRAEEHEDGQ